MLNTPRARRGMVTSSHHLVPLSWPHHLAKEAGLRVRRDGGNASQATIARAASITGVYLHMTSMGGDGFCLVTP